MNFRLGQTAILGATLLACLLVASLPSRVVRLSFCDCGETTLALATSRDQDCVCPDQRLARPGCGSDCKPGTCEKAPPRPAEPEPEQPDDDSCCTHLPLPDLLSSSWSSQDDWSGDTDPDLTTPLSPPDRVTAWLRDLRPRATGPPTAVHHIRRGLLERRAIVLLI